MPLKIITFCTSVVESVYFNHLNYNNKVLAHLLQIINTLGHIVFPWFQASSGFQYENQLADSEICIKSLTDHFTACVLLTLLHQLFLGPAYSDAEFIQQTVSL